MVITKEIHILDEFLLAFCYLLVPVSSVGAGLLLSLGEYALGGGLILFGVFVAFCAKVVLRYYVNFEGSPRGSVFFKSLGYFFKGFELIVENSFDRSYPYVFRAVTAYVLFFLVTVVRYVYVPLVALLVAFVLS